MAAIQATRLKKGMLVKMDSDLFRVLELQHVTPGNLRGFVRVKLRNIRSGTTTVHDLDKRTLGSFTLTDPLDAALVDDARRYHGVTPVEPENPDQPAWRDVLVVTFRRA